MVRTNQSSHEKHQKVMNAETQAFLEALKEKLDLSQEFFDGVQLEDHDFGGCDLSGLVMCGSTFIDCDFTESDLSSSSIWDSKFIRCKFNEARINSSWINEVLFSICETHSFDMSELTASECYFTNCFGAVDLTGGQFQHVNLQSCDLRISILKNTQFDSCLLEWCNLGGTLVDDQTEFTETKFDNCEITDVNLSAVKGYSPSAFTNPIVAPFAPLAANDETIDLKELANPQAQQTIGFSKYLAPTTNKTYIVDEKAYLWCSHLEEFRKTRR